MTQKQLAERAERAEQKKAALLEVVSNGMTLQVALAPSKNQIRRLCAATGYQPEGPYYLCPVHIRGPKPEKEEAKT